MKPFSQCIDPLVLQQRGVSLLEAYEMHLDREPDSESEQTPQERPVPAVLTVAELRERRQCRREAYERRRQQKRRRQVANRPPAA